MITLYNLGFFVSSFTQKKRKNRNCFKSIMVHQLKQQHVFPKTFHTNFPEDVAVLFGENLEAYVIRLKCAV